MFHKIPIIGLLLWQNKFLTIRAIYELTPIINSFDRITTTS